MIPSIKRRQRNRLLSLLGMLTEIAHVSGFVAGAAFICVLIVIFFGNFLP